MIGRPPRSPLFPSPPLSRFFFLPAALRRVQRLVHRRDDVGDRYPFDMARESVAPAGPADAVDQGVAPQLAEKVLQIRERDALPPADAGKRYRTIAAVHGEVQHRGHCESSFGRQSHGCTLNGSEYPINSVKYTQSRWNRSTIYLLTTFGSSRSCFWVSLRSA